MVPSVALFTSGIIHVIIANTNRMMYKIENAESDDLFFLSFPIFFPPIYLKTGLHPIICSYVLHTIRMQAPVRRQRRTNRNTGNNRKRCGKLYFYPQRRRLVGGDNRTVTAFQRIACIRQRGNNCLPFFMIADKL